MSLTYAFLNNWMVGNTLEHIAQICLWIDAVQRVMRSRYGAEQSSCLFRRGGKRGRPERFTVFPFVVSQTHETSIGQTLGPNLSVRLR